MKAVTAAQLAMASDGVYRVTLDEAIEAMRLTAADMSVKYKETSLSVSVSCVTWFLAKSHTSFPGPCGKFHIFIGRYEGFISICLGVQTTVKIPLSVPAWCVPVFSFLQGLAEVYHS